MRWVKIIASPVLTPNPLPPPNEINNRKYEDKMFEILLNQIAQVKTASPVKIT